MKAVICLLLMIGLTGCQALRNQKPLLSDSGLLQQAAGPEQTARLHSELVRGMIDRGQYYAALAHLEEQERKTGGSDEIRHLRADTLSRLGRHDEAQQIYQGLLRGSFAAEAHHGIALYHQDKSNDAEALSHFRDAVRLKPTDAQMRNDLGYALMLQGEKADARLHLATAFELAAATERFRNNYIMALIWMGDEDTARKVAKAADVDGKTMADLRIRAQKLRVKQAEGLKSSENSAVVTGRAQNA